MILTCNSCGKKFVVPDNAITASGRTVQCGSCGNKWKQFPSQNFKKETIIDKKISSSIKKSVPKITKPKSKKVKKPREINLYSPEYLQKKHGISLNNVEKNRKQIIEKKVSFGFYNSLLLLIVLIIIASRGLYFFQDFITQNLPFTEFYLNYFFESIRNMFEIFKNLISSY
tara:strand:- start:353 stop:865 length:513 start_codon:yes stop_codon:yes gene_type:complete